MNPKPIRIEFASIYGHRTKQGLVEMRVGAEETQMDITKAKEVLGLLAGAIEAAISDGLLVRFLVEKIGLPEEAAARALLDFREMRQGSRETVYPQ
jgi:hypothetical protein